MTRTSKHIIEKLKFEFNTTSEEQGKLLESRSIELFQQRLLPELEGILDRHGSNKNIKLDNLSIEINTSDPSYFEDQFVQQFIQQLSKELKNISGNIPDSSENLIQVFDYFLEKGYFPWWAQEVSIQQLEKQIIEVIKTEKGVFTTLNFDSKKLSRLVYQFSDQFLQTTTYQYFKEENKLVEFKDSLQKNLSRFYNSTKVRNQLWLFLLDAILIKKYSLEKAKDSLFIESIRHFSNTQKSLDSKSYSEKVLNDLVVKELEIKENDFFLKLQSSSQSSIKEKKSIASKTKHEVKTESLENFKKDIINQNSEQKEWYIKNAGLVLLHPFLVMLFEGLGLTKNNVFKDKHSRNQAVLLSQYLVTGDHQFSENELMLNKIFCGIDFTESIENELLLNDKIVAESNQLLNAVIKHWSALKNTSPDGLQNTFLKREGKLTKNNDGSWKLFIQHNAFDILISKLPWSVSIIKLPWMKNMLQVEWA